MEMIFCPNCNKLTGYKRVIGFGTFFAVLLTAGLWLLTLPFYPKRCITCGLTKSDSVPWYQTWRVMALAVPLIVVVSALIDNALQPKQPVTIINAYEHSIPKAHPTNTPSVNYPVITPAQLLANGKRYLNGRVGIVGATVTRISTKYDVADTSGVLPQPQWGCDYLLQLNYRVQACVPDTDLYVTQLHIGQQIGGTCTVGYARDVALLINCELMNPDTYSRLKEP